MRFITLVLSLAAMSHSDVVRASTPQELTSRTSSLRAGDTLLVAAGAYEVTGWTLSGLSGDPNQWIVVLADGHVVIRGISDCCNVVQMTNVHYLYFKGFEITVQAGVDGPDGVKINGVHNSYLVLDSLYIHDVTFGGIEMFPDSGDHITVRNCEIANTAASGMYIGYPDKNILHDVVVENNYIHHCPVDPLSDIYYGIQLKGWCYRSRITDNVLHDVSGTSRSAICVYYGKNGPAGDLVSDMNVVAGNVIWNGRGEGITAMSDALIENNIVFDAGLGLHLQTYNDGTFTGANFVENLVVRNNTLFRCQSECLFVEQWTAATLGSNVSVTGNAAYQASSGDAAVYCSISGTGARISGNRYYGTCTPAGAQGFVSGAGLSDFVAVNASSSVPGIDFYPSGTSTLLEALPESLAAPVDFNNAARPVDNAADAGAYERDNEQNPGWLIEENFKGVRDSVGIGGPFFRRAPGLRLSVHPNPAVSSFQLEYSLGGNAGRIDLSDISGRKIMTLQVMEEGRFRVRTADVGSGIYMARLSSGNSRISRRILVIR